MPAVVKKSINSGTMNTQRIDLALKTWSCDIISPMPENVGVVVKSSRNYQLRFMLHQKLSHSDWFRRVTRLIIGKKNALNSSVGGFSLHNMTLRYFRKSGPGVSESNVS